jgi:hypothetical protein
MGGGALGRIAFAGILLDHDPATECYVLQRAHYGRDIDHPAPERAEDDLAEGVGEAPTLFPGAGENAGIDVLEVEMADQRALLADELGRVATAIGVVSGVEAEGCASPGKKFD